MTENKENNIEVKQIETKEPKKEWRGSWQRIRTWQDGRLVGNSVLNLTFRKKLVCNLFVQTYTKGMFPHFKPQYLEQQLVCNIPLPVIKHLLEITEKKGFRIRKQDNHKWHFKMYAKSSKKKLEVQPNGIQS